MNEDESTVRLDRIHRLEHLDDLLRSAADLLREARALVHGLEDDTSPGGAACPEAVGTTRGTTRLLEQTITLLVLRRRETELEQYP